MSGITRTTSIPQANIFGRIGTGLGQGLAEQLPKEFERARLGNALDQLGQQTNNSPWQNYTGLVKAAHEYPQIVQSGENLLRRQGIARGFESPGQGRAPLPAAAPPGYPGAPGMGQTPANVAPGVGAGRGGPPPSRTETGHEAGQNVASTESGQSQVNPKNPLSPELQPKNRWTPQEWRQRYGQNLTQYPHLNEKEAEKLTNEDEARELAQPQGEQAKVETLKGIEERLNGRFRERLGLKLHTSVDPKTGIDGSLAKIPGTAQNNLIRGMAQDIVDHPNKSEEDVINDWSERGADLAKTREQFIGRTNSQLLALPPIPTLLNKQGVNREIDEDRDVYIKAGNQEEFYKDLQNYYGMSPVGSAYKAYPRSEPVDKYISNIKEPKITKGSFPDQPKKIANKIASDVAKIMGDKDSILAIAKAIKYKNPWFDDNSFYQYFSDNADNLRLNPEQRRQLGQSGQLMGNWADFLILPF